MPTLSERRGVDLKGYTPITAPSNPVPSLVTSSKNVEPGLNPYLRCPLPPIWQSSPDSLRQFYHNGVVPQVRLFNPAKG